jgi:hypothetical protein
MHIRQSFFTQACVWLLVAMCVGSWGCSSVFQVQTSAAPSIDFTQYNRFSFYPYQPALHASAGDAAAVVEEVKKQLLAKGWKEQQDGQRVQINILSVFDEITPAKADSLGLGGSYRPYRYASDAAATAAASPIKGLLMLDMVDPQTGGLVWQGSVKVPLRKLQKNRNATIDAAVKQLLQQFPPQ